MKKRSLYSASLAMALGLFGATAHAVYLFPYAPTTFEDQNLDFLYVDDGETLVSGTGPWTPNGNRVLDIGDVLLAVIEVTELVDNSGGGGPSILVDSLGIELTGLAVIEVVGKTDLGNGNFQVDFGPAALWPAINGADDIPGDYPGAIAAFWVDDDPDLDTGNCTSLNDCITKATDGYLWQVDGKPEQGEEGYDADNEWAYTGPVAAEAVYNALTTSGLGAATYALSNLYQSGGTVTNNLICDTTVLTCAGDGIVDLTGNGTIFGGRFPVLGQGQLANDAFSVTDFDYTKSAVPEPATIALLSVGLLGFGTARIRRKS